jgi:hypothetical protein
MGSLNPAAADRMSLLVAVDDPTPGQVIRGELDDHPVLRKDPDIVLTHLATDMGEYAMTVLELYPEHRVREWLHNPAFDLDGPVLLRHVLRCPALGCSTVDTGEDQRLLTAGS